MGKLHRLRQVAKYGWQHAEQISQKEFGGKKQMAVFFDIFGCYRKYGMWSNQYLKEKMWELDKAKREEIGNKYGEANKKREVWLKDFYENRNFYIKYGNIKYEKESLRTKRNQAYAKRYNAGKNLFVEYGVIISRQHYVDGTISIGDDVILARDVDIDYTGDVFIGNDVRISEGVKILSHNHPIDKHVHIEKTPLVISDYVGFGARALILPGVKEIGRGASIAAGAIVKRQVPPYAIVMGNPARVVGFRMTPDQIVEFEKEKYEEKDRLPLELLESNYEKYFLSRVKEIQQFLV